MICLKRILIFLAEYYDTSTDYLLGITSQNQLYPKNNKD